MMMPSASRMLRKMGKTLGFMFIVVEKYEEELSQKSNRRLESKLFQSLRCMKSPTSALP
jgi:hypothetical protein